MDDLKRDNEPGKEYPDHNPDNHKEKNQTGGEPERKTSGGATVILLMLTALAAAVIAGIYLINAAKSASERVGGEEESASRVVLFRQPEEYTESTEENTESILEGAAYADGTADTEKDGEQSRTAQSNEAQSEPAVSEAAQSERDSAEADPKEGKASYPSAALSAKQTDGEYRNTLRSAAGVPANCSFFIRHMSSHCMSQRRETAAEKTEGRSDAGQSFSKNSVSALEDLQQVSSEEEEFSEKADERSEARVDSIVKASLAAIVCSSDEGNERTSSEEIQADGSGVILKKTENYYFLATNTHVVDGAETVSVVFSDGTGVPGTVAEIDNDYDLAIVLIDRDQLSDETGALLQTIRVADASELVIGDTVTAVGYAADDFYESSTGIVNALGRRFVDTAGKIRNFIQIDAEITESSNGGALLNQQGELVAINDAAFYDETGSSAGYAIPIADLIPVLQRVLRTISENDENGEGEAYLGVTGMTMLSYYVELGYPEGVFIVSVVPDGPADCGGILEQDILMMLDGISAPDNETLMSLLGEYAPQDEITVTVCRFNEQVNAYEDIGLQVTLGERPEDTSSDAENMRDEGENWDTYSDHDWRPGYGSDDDYSDLFGDDDDADGLYDYHW